MIFTALDIADNDLALWSQHLDQTGSRYTIIENQLTRFMLVHMCGHYETEIKGIILNRVEKSGDPGVTSYVKFPLERRAPMHPDSLKSVLKRFGGECLDRFVQNTTEADLHQYANIVVNRKKALMVSTPKRLLTKFAHTMPGPSALLLRLIARLSIKGVLRQVCTPTTKIGCHGRRTQAPIINGLEHGEWGRIWNGRRPRPGQGRNTLRSSHSASQSNGACKEMPKGGLFPPQLGMAATQPPAARRQT